MTGAPSLLTFSILPPPKELYYCLNRDFGIMLLERLEFSIKYEALGEGPVTWTIIMMTGNRDEWQ